MKRLFQRIKLHKLKTELNRDCFKDWEGQEFIVLFFDGKYECCYFKEDLIDLLEKDHIRRIRYVFDMTDRICVDREVLIDTKEVIKHE